MPKVTILKYDILCAQGDLHQSVEAIKNSTLHTSTKVVSSPDEEIQIPYFSLKDEVEDTPDAIYKGLQTLLLKTLSSLDEQQRKESALIIGTSLVDWHVVHAIKNSVYAYKKTPYSSQKRGIDSYAKQLSKEFGLSDFTMTINTACTSSANALLEGANLIKASVFNYVVVIGVEIFSTMMSSGFSSMRLLSTSSQKPFDKNREGLILGEALSSVLLGKESAPWSLEGGYSNCSSLTITSVSPSGEEYVEVMQKALEQCNLQKEQITALKAHATSTLANDLSEINALSKLFSKDLLFCALKPYTGHTLGACGTLELALFMACVDNGFLPKTHNHTESIQEDFSPLLEHKACTEGIFMLNYFGFGGNNTSLIIKKESL